MRQFCNGRLTVADSLRREFEDITTFRPIDAPLGQWGRRLGPPERSMIELAQGELPICSDIEAGNHLWIASGWTIHPVATVNATPLGRSNVLGIPRRANFAFCPSDSRPLHCQGVNLLRADVAREYGGTVRGNADFRIPTRAGRTVQVFQAGDGLDFTIRQAHPENHGVSAAGGVLHRLLVRGPDPVDEVMRSGE
ncbi:hypothetical protein SBA3_2590014 [Candidatus Sulfopaludibacter sp. SbA3]|nr:hypothetical protein SBA3_2590014 [Candidatus Sulfopaludibacter sp. SbA3]